MNIEVAERIAELVNARNEFKRVKDILVTDLSSKLNGPFIITASSADVVVGNYKVTLSKHTISLLIRMMDDQCKEIEKTLSIYDADIKIHSRGDGADSPIASE